MKRLLQVLLLTVFALGAFAEGDGVDNVLLWFFENPDVEQVDGSQVKASQIVGRGGEAEDKEINMLRISVTDADGNKTYLGLGDPTGGYLDGWELPDYVGQWKAGPGYADISGLNLSETGLMFTMELGYAEFDDQNDDTKWIVLAVSKSQTVENLRSFIISSELSYQGSFDWDGGGFAVPEPSSGLMMVIGAALLALRRRRNLRFVSC